MYNNFNKLILFLILLLFSVNVKSQTISLDDLKTFLNISELEKLDNFASSKNFEFKESSRFNDCDKIQWISKDYFKKSEIQVIQKFCDKENESVVLYSTNSLTSFEKLKLEVIDEGFQKYAENALSNSLNLFYKNEKFKVQFTKFKGVSSNDNICQIFISKAY